KVPVDDQFRRVNNGGATDTR
nr:RecName: Full=54 kDa cell wall protein [Arabidopsis thaliana]